MCCAKRCPRCSSADLADTVHVLRIKRGRKRFPSVGLESGLALEIVLTLILIYMRGWSCRGVTRLST